MCYSTDLYTRSLYTLENFNGNVMIFYKENIEDLV